MSPLKQTLGRVQFFSIGFGVVVGAGWIVYLGVWFNQAGPVGTALAFVLGGLLMSLVGLCYAEAASMLPLAGGEAVYAREAFGRSTGFVVGWALVLLYTSVVPYVSSSMAWMLDALVPGMGGPVLYHWRGQPIQATGLVIAVGWTLWLGFVNARGVRTSARFQDWLTYGKIAISALFIGAGLFGGSAANLEPWFVAAPSGSVVGGMVTVLATAPWFFGGFNAIPQALEERAPGTSTRALGLIIVAVILAGALYYGLAALAAGMAAPWRDTAAANLPAAAAFRSAFGSEWLARVVLVTGLFGIVTVGNGATMAATRVLYSLGRDGSIAPAFGAVHAQTGTPWAAIVAVTLLGLAGDFLGRSGIAPIVNVGSALGALAYLMTALAVWQFRRRAPERPRPYRMPLGTLIAAVAASGSLFLLLSAFRQHWLDAKGGFPLEWAVLGVWTAVGAWQWRRYGSRQGEGKGAGGNA